MQIVIDTRYCPCRTLNDECGISENECYEDDICATCPLIRNGGAKLPKGHGRMIDADRLREEMEKDVRRAMSFVDLIDFVWLAPTIIKRDDS